MRLAVGLVSAFLVVIPRASLAQTVMRSPDDARLLVDVNVYGTSESDADQRIFQSRFIAASEAASAAATYPKPSRANTFVDLGGSFMVTHRLGVGVNYSWNSRDDVAGLQTTVPHPTFYGAAATATGQTSELSRREGMTNIYLAFMPIRNNRVEWRLLGGPTIFSLKADMVSDVTYAQNSVPSSPDQTLTVTGFTTAQVKATELGYHVGTDVTYFLTKFIGVGGGVRFSQDNITLDQEPLSKLSQDIRVGGTQVGVGVRLRLSR